MDDWLVDGRVQRVRVGHVGEREVALLQVRVVGRTAVVVVAGGVGVGVLDKTAHARLRDAIAGDVASTQPQWRAQLEGASVEEVTLREVRLRRDEKAWRAAVRAGAAKVFLERREEPSPAGERSVGHEELLAAGAAIVEKLYEGATTGRATALRRSVEKAMARVRRRRDAVRADLARAEAAEGTARGAELFVAEAARAPRGATRLVAVDWSDGSPREVVFPLDPAKGAREQLDAVFRKARRMKDGARIAEQRLRDADGILVSLSAVAEALVAGGDIDLVALEARARQAAPRDFSLPRVTTPSAGPRRPGTTQRPLPPHRTYLSTSGARVLVGRGAEKNDALTFHVARPHDLWLHAKGRTGAHVVVPLAKGASCPADVLVEAAHLAAHFSDGKGEGAVEVQYTPRRYLRKPRGSAPGLVVVDREKVMLLRRDADLLRRLLEREET